MRFLEIRNYIEDYFGFDLASRDRHEDMVGARAVYSKILREHFKYGWCAIGRSINRNHASIINSVNKFEIYRDSNLKVDECYSEILVMLGVKEEVKKFEIKQLKLSPQLNQCIEIMRNLSDREIADFIPRVEIYKKSVIYNRKKKKQWERPTTKI